MREPISAFIKLRRNPHMKNNPASAPPASMGCRKKPDKYANLHGFAAVFE